jgi:hypothetical protein
MIKVYMSRLDLFAKIDAAIAARNPKLSKQLCPGMPRGSLRKKLSDLPGDKEALFDLYSWHNGTMPVREQKGTRYVMSYDDLTFVPCEILVLPSFDLMLADFGSWSSAKKQHRFLRDVAGRCFPFLWDGGTTWLSLELGETGRQRVMAVEFESDTPVREAYGSFEDCLIDILKANEDEVPLNYQ